MPRGRSLTILLVALITVLSIHLVFQVLEGVRADVTASDLYSLSEGTLQILEKMEEEGVQPLEMKLYFSETTGKTLPRFIKDFITYQRYLHTLLEEYERAAKGKIEVRFIDPLTDSDEEQEAIKDGLEGRPINQHGDKFFFGLTVETQTGSKETIPFLWPNEQESIEYEITKRVSSLLWPSSQHIGIVSSLEVFGTADNPYLAQMLAAQGRSPSEKWLAVQLLEERYDVSKIELDTAHISHDEYDLVIVIHPKNLPRKTLWALDEWVVTGGKTMVFLDPYAITDQAPQDPQQPWAALQYEPSSSLDPLLRAWGLRMPPQTFAADFDLAMSRPVVRGGPSETVVVDLHITEPVSDQTLTDHPILQGLDDLRFFLPGVLEERSATTDGENDTSETAAGTGAAGGEVHAGAVTPLEEGGQRTWELRPLITTTDAGDTLEIRPGFGGEGGLYYTDLNNAAKLRDHYAPGGRGTLAVAYQITGKLPSAFPEGVEFPSTAPEQPPGLPPGVELPPPEGTETVTEDPVSEEERRETTVLVFSDVDVISDPLAFQRNILGVVTAANDNPNLLLNSADHLLGAQELMRVRTARSLDRPFTLFDEIEGDAEQETLAREREIRAQIQGFQEQLQEKQSEITSRDAALFQRKVQEDVNRLNERIQEANAQLRAIRQQRRAALEEEETKVRFAVLGWMPTLVLILGLVLLLRRKRLESEAKREA